MTEREIAELKVAYEDVANRHNALATVLAGLVVEMASAEYFVVESDQMAVACEILGYPDQWELLETISRDIRDLPAEDKEDRRRIIIQEILAGTYLNGEGASANGQDRD